MRSVLARSGTSKVYYALDIGSECLHILRSRNLSYVARRLMDLGMIVHLLHILLTRYMKNIAYASLKKPARVPSTKLDGLLHIQPPEPIP